MTSKIHLIRITFQLPVNLRPLQVCHFFKNRANRGRVLLGPAAFQGLGINLTGGGKQRGGTLQGFCESGDNIQIFLKNTDLHGGLVVFSGRHHRTPDFEHA